MSPQDVGQPVWCRQSDRPYELRCLLLQVLLALGTYMIVAFIFNLLDEVRPIFASAPVEVGGLALSTNVLSWPLSFGGLCFILFACLGRFHPFCTSCHDKVHCTGCMLNIARRVPDELAHVLSRHLLVQLWSV